MKKHLPYIASTLVILGTLGTLVMFLANSSQAQVNASQDLKIASSAEAIIGIKASLQDIKNQQADLNKLLIILVTDRGYNVQQILSSNKTTRQ